MKERYGLEPQVISNRRRFTVKLTTVAIDLIEATSKYMRGFGEVPKLEQKPLDDRITKMIAVVEELNTILSR
ncbi:MAG: hypothetical protein ACLQAT_17080 [Candidatus Binataceae bacterium]